MTRTFDASGVEIPEACTGRRNLPNRSSEEGIQKGAPKVGPSSAPLQLRCCKLGGQWLHGALSLKEDPGSGSEYLYAV